MVWVASWTAAGILIPNDSLLLAGSFARDHPAAAATVAHSHALRHHHARARAPSARHSDSRTAKPPAVQCHGRSRPGWNRTGHSVEHAALGRARCEGAGSVRACDERIGLVVRFLRRAER